MFERIVGTTLGLWLIFWLAVLWGWILNIINFAHSNDSVFTTHNVLRIVGFFVAPLGAVFGFFMKN